MYHHFDTITNTKGDSLPGWQVECVLLSDGSTVVDIYADENGTPISSVSGVTNRAVADEYGEVSFFVETGEYSLRFYNAEGVFQRLRRFINMQGAAATAAQLWEGAATDAYISPAVMQEACAPTTLTSGTTITPNFNLGANFDLTLAHNATLANPTNAQVGDCGVILVQQDATGSRTLAYGSQWKFPGGAPTLSTTANAIDTITYCVMRTGVIVCGLAKAYAS